MIAGAGFAMMAWRLAQTRHSFSGFLWPRPRELVGHGENRHAEYYRIIDNATHADAMRRAISKLGMLDGCFEVRL